VAGNKKPEDREHNASEMKTSEEENSSADVNKQPMINKTSQVVLGTRFKCCKCGTKFYDMGRLQPLCPLCGADQREGVSKTLRKRKKWRRSTPFIKQDHAITAPIEREDQIEKGANEDVAEYALDVADTVLVDNED